MMGGTVVTNIQKKDESAFFRLLLNAAVAMLIGIAVCFALMLILSAVALGFDDPNGYIAPFATVALFMGALACGIASRRSGTVASLMSGGFYVLVLWLVSLSFRVGGGESVGILVTLLGYGGCIAVSFVGGNVGKRSAGFGAMGKKSPTAQLRRRIGRR